MSDKYRAAFAVCSGVLCSLLCFEFSGITYGGNSYNIADAVNMAMKGDEFFQKGAKKVGIVMISILVGLGIVLLLSGSVYNFLRKRYENVIASTYLFELFSMVSGILIISNVFSKYRGYSFHASNVMYLVMLLSVVTSFIIKADVGKPCKKAENINEVEPLPATMNEDSVLNEHVTEAEENTVKICINCFSTYDGKLPGCPHCK